MILVEAQRLADRIVAQLQPFCLGITVAGSIRRCCPVVNDIDLVLIPLDLAVLRERVLRNATPIQDGPLNLLVRLENGFQLDIFMAHAGKADLLGTTPTNFGSLLLCRTGSKEHNIKLASRAHSLGLKWKTYDGIFDGLGNGRLIASATEHDMFAALQMDFVPPEHRI